MGRQAQKLKVDECYEIILHEFSKFIDPRPIFEIPLINILMSSLAVFVLKSPSLLQFEKDCCEFIETRVKNLITLFKIDRIPSDTQLRDVLDQVNYEQYRVIFKKLFALIQRSKTLEMFEFMKIKNITHYLIAVDGSGYYRSDKIACDCCMIEEHFDCNNTMKIKFAHNILGASIVHPDLQQVISLCPEPIMRLDGACKNDSEQTAFRRFLLNFKREHPKLKAVFVLDALYANGPIIRLLRENGYEFIIGVKESKSVLFLDAKVGEIDGRIEFLENNFEHGDKVKKTTTMKYRYGNGMRLHQDKETPIINLVEVQEITEWTDIKEKAQRVERNFSFITDITITKKNIEQLAEGGRTRWKIENETFNTLKNRGYNLEHNYGHGEKNLTHNFIMNMFLAFLVDQIQEMSCLAFKRLIYKFGSRSSLWRMFEKYFDSIVFKSWDQMYYRLYFREMPPETS